MIVWPVKINKEAAELLEKAEVAGTSINELPSVSLSGNRAFENEFSILAGIDAMLFKKEINFFRFTQKKDRLNPRQTGSRADDTPIGALSQKEFQRPDDD